MKCLMVKNNKTGEFYMGSYGSFDNKKGKLYSKKRFAASAISNLVKHRSMKREDLDIEEYELKLVKIYKHRE